MTKSYIVFCEFIHLSTKMCYCSPVPVTRFCDAHYARSNIFSSNFFYIPPDQHSEFSRNPGSSNFSSGKSPDLQKKSAHFYSGHLLTTPLSMLLQDALRPPLDITGQTSSFHSILLISHKIKCTDSPDSQHFPTTLTVICCKIVPDSMYCKDKLWPRSDFRCSEILPAFYHPLK